MAAQDTLQKLWLRGKAGGLAPREQLKAWALREAWQDTGGARGLTMAALPKHTRPRQPARPPGRGVGWGRGGGGVVAVGGWSRSAEKAKPHRAANHYTHVRNGARRKLTNISHRSDSDRCENKFIFGFTVWCWAVMIVLVVYDGSRLSLLPTKFVS